MKLHSKRFNKANEVVDKNKAYDLKEAVSVLKLTPKVKFDESLELHFQLNIDPKKSDQMVRGTVKLPHGTGKKVRIVVICKGEHEKQAREAGADFVGGLELINKIEGGWLDFDKTISTPDMMRDLSKLGKILGPRGLMPSPKTGSVTTDVVSAIKESKGGKIEFKMDKQAGIHLSIGKISFDESQILENANAVIEAVTSSKPSQIKGKFLKSASISTTMGPGLRLSL